MSAVFECVPNVSEGRNAETIAACAHAIEQSGAHLAHQTSDADHNRSVFTFFGDATAIERAAGALARTCVERIDLRAHAGVHPRIGALDVFPVVPMGDATIEEAAAVARAAAQRMWLDAALPAILYGAAATSPGRVALGDVRRGQFEGLRAREAAGERADAGDRLFHPGAGTAAIGARAILIACNIELGGADRALAKTIARTLRERSGGLRTLRALGLQTADVVQLSCNLTDVAAIPLDRLVGLAARIAARSGARVTGAELIGLLPRAALASAVERFFEG